MKRTTLLKTMLLLCALVAGSSSVWADDVLYYTLDGSISVDATNSSNYDKAIDIEQDDITWNVKGNTKENPWRIGGKKSTIDSSTGTADRLVYSKTAMGSAITEVKLVIGTASITVNSVKLIVASDADFSSQIDEINGSYAANSTISFKPTSPETKWAKDAYYKFVINITNTTTSNKYVEFKKAEFYKEPEAGYVAPPSITPSAGFMVDKGTVATITQASSTSIKYTTDGTDPTSSATATTGVSGATVTINANTTIKAVAYNGANVSSITEVNYTVRPDMDLASNIFSANDFSAVSGSYGEYDLTFSGYEGWHSNQVCKSSGYLQFKKSEGVLTSPTIKTVSGFTIKVTYAESGKCGTMTSGASDTSTESGTISTLTTTSTSTKITIYADASNTVKITKIEIIPAELNVTIAGSGYSTLAKAIGLDFANATPTGLEAYVASAVSASAVTLTAVDEASASTGVILKGTAGETYSIPVKADAAAVGTNYLKAAVTATTLDDGSFYVMKGGKFCLVTGTADEAARTVPAGKAYLLKSDVPAAAPELMFVFGESETTGINDVKRETITNNGEVYNLNGQRVAQPKKGLYVVNGKKVIIK